MKTVEKQLMLLLIVLVSGLYTMNVLKYLLQKQEMNEYWFLELFGMLDLFEIYRKVHVKCSKYDLFCQRKIAGRQDGRTHLIFYRKSMFLFK